MSSPEGDASESLPSFVDAFDNWAKLLPTQLAVCGGSVSWSWDELCKKSRVAERHILAECSKSTGKAVDVVAILAHRSPQWLAATIGVMRCNLPFVWMGAGELPLKGRYAERQRNDQIMQVLHPELLLLDAAAAPEVIPDWEQVSRPRVLPLESLQSEICDAVVQHGIRTAQQALCYQLTGGTTGSSKCVRISHEMALHEVAAYPKAFKTLSSQDRVLQHTPVLWAASAIGQINIAVSFGACICIAEMDQDSISRNGATVLGTVPSALRSINPQAVPTVRCVFCWGESMSPVLATQWRSEKRRVIELLISTEYWLSLYSEGTMSVEGRTVYCAVPGADIAVLENGTLSTDCNATGQLCLRGPMVTTRQSMAKLAKDTVTASICRCEVPRPACSFDCHTTGCQ